MYNVHNVHHMVTLFVCVRVYELPSMELTDPYLVLHIQSPFVW